MQYLLLIYEDERNYMGQEPSADMFKPWFDYTDATKEAGVYVAGAGLQPTATATTVRVRDGKPLTTDRPFAETKEQLGAITCWTARIWTRPFPGPRRSRGVHRGAPAHELSRLGPIV